MPLTVHIRNTNDHKMQPAFGNYYVTVYMGDNVIAEGPVKDHERSKGWRDLLGMIAKTKAVKDK